MSAEPYIGNIIIFAGLYAPQGWAFCQGQLLNISDYEALYTLIGTTYGGDGQSTFGLPDLRGRAPLHYGSTIGIGQQAGTETVTLTADQLPAHTHNFGSGQAAIGVEPTYPPATSANPVYAPNSGTDRMALGTIGNFVGNGAHENRQPYIGMNYIIALYGVFPPRS